jgi:hypothetical protein
VPLTGLIKLSGKTPITHSREAIARRDDVRRTHAYTNYISGTAV